MSDQFAHLEELRAALIKLDQRRVELVAEIQQIQNEIAVEQDPDSSGVNAHSPEGDKIRLFRELFAGRIDVFPVRFESRKSGRSGYQPACKNEWRPGVCRKPKVKCAKLPPSRKTKDQISGENPKSIEVVLANQVYVPKKDLSPSLRNALLRLAAFRNPEFYKAQAMRLPVFDKPRII